MQWLKARTISNSPPNWMQSAVQIEVKLDFSDWGAYERGAEVSTQNQAGVYLATSV